MSVVINGIIDSAQGEQRQAAPAWSMLLTHNRVLSLTAVRASSV